MFLISNKLLASINTTSYTNLACTAICYEYGMFDKQVRCCEIGGKSIRFWAFPTDSLKAGK
jgi:hypothetical protein